MLKNFLKEEIHKKSINLHSFYYFKKIIIKINNSKYHT